MNLDIKKELLALEAQKDKGFISLKTYNLEKAKLQRVPKKPQGICSNCKLNTNCSRFGFGQHMHKCSDFELKSRFMPNVKFTLHLQDLLELSTTNWNQFVKKASITGFLWAKTNSNGTDFAISSRKPLGFEKVISKYEAIPELIPNGMRYSNYYNKLVPADKVTQRNFRLNNCNNSLCSIDNVEKNHSGSFHQFLLEDWPNKNIEPNVKTLHKRDEFVKFDKDKTRYDLVCPHAYEDLAKLLTFGAKKYDENNWMKGNINSYIAALERHLAEIKKGATDGNTDLFIDQDSNLQHGAALLCNSMFLHYFINKKLKGEN